MQGDYFAAATADLERRSVVRVGDVIELRVIGPGGNAESQTLSFKVTPEDLANAVLSVNLDGIGQPTSESVVAELPNPFNPETWIPYQLSEDSLRYRSPFMIQRVSWFAHFRSVFNPQAFTIVRGVRHIGMGAMLSVNALRVVSIFTS